MLLILIFKTKIMKKYLLPITMILLLPIYINAQNDFCGYDPTEPRLVEIPYATIDQNVTRQSFHDDPPLVLKVHFWDVNDGSGNNPHPLTEQQVLNEIAELNKNYNDLNIFLKYDGMTSFNAEDYYIFDSDQANIISFHTFLHDNNYYFEGFVNIYSVLEIDQDITAFYSLGSYYSDFDIIVSEYWAIDSQDYPQIMTHEVGHKFNLEHTFFCGRYGTKCEHVVRDENHEHYNADDEGDYIVDTYATPKWYEYDPVNCVYTDNLVDETGMPYDFEGYSPEVTNYMSYQFDCASEFSNGQAAVMRWYIYYINSNPDITVVKTYSPEILYEPYEGEYGLCNGSEAHNPKFQYGFDYEFIECRLYDINSQNCPTDYGDHDFILGADAYDEFDSSETYDSSYDLPIIHPNHTAIIINQLPYLTNNYAEKCYDAWKNASSGSVKNFLDGVINYNYTIQYLDSLQVNNPDLVPNLQNGLYNIDKQYIDGQNIDKTILKTNNQ